MKLWFFFSSPLSFRKIIFLSFLLVEIIFFQPAAFATPDGLGNELFPQDNVGIGTDAPNGRLDVRGDQVMIWTGVGTNDNVTASGELYVEGALEVDGALYVPVGTVPDVGSAGGFAVDTTDDQLVYYGAVKRVLSYKRSKAFTIEYPLDTDMFLFFKTLDPITIIGIECIVDPADAGESVVVDIQERDSAGDNPATVDAAITCDNDGATDDGTLSNGSIAANSWVSVDIGTVTGAVGQVAVTVYYMRDAQ